MKNGINFACLLIFALFACSMQETSFSMAMKDSAKREIATNNRQRREISNTETDWYVEAIFYMFDEKSTSFLLLDDFKRLLSTIGLGAMAGDHGHDHSGHEHDHSDHDHDHSDHNHDHSDHDHDHSDYNHDHSDHDHDHSDHGHDHSDHNHDHSDHDHDHSDYDHDHSDHDHDHSDHDHSDHHRRRRALDNDHSDHDHDEKSGQKNTTDENENKCTSMDKLLTDHGLHDKVYDASELDVSDFKILCPALIEHMVAGVCKQDKDHAHHAHQEEDNANEGDRNMALVWFYVFLCVTIISMCAIVGIIFIPKKSSSMYKKTIQFLMALAAGSMTGDALLHLMPHALMPPHDHSAHGHEGHSHEGHGHGEDEDSHADEHTKALLKGLVALIGLYFFFFLERIFTIWSLRFQGNRRDACGNHQDGAARHGHSHGDVDENIKFITTSQSNHTTITLASPVDEVDDLSDKNHHWPHPGITNDTGNEAQSPEKGSEGCCPNLNLKPLALMIILGDMCHNFCDGLAIGAAFASNTTVGISTSIAVFCHEFPHEIGDFAVLIKSGLSNKKAIILNFASALTCYLGAIIGMFLGNVSDASTWVFAGIAGMFLYIGLVDLVPEMTHVYTSSGESWKSYLPLHIAGLVMGAVLMLILGIYEHDIQMALN